MRSGAASSASVRQDLLSERRVDGDTENRQLFERAGEVYAKPPRVAADDPSVVGLAGMLRKPARRSAEAACAFHPLAFRCRSPLPVSWH